MRIAIAIAFVFYYGSALAQRNAPPHVGGVVAGGGSGDLVGFLLAIVGIFIGVMLLVGVFELLGWIMALSGKLWRRFREILRR